MKLSELIQEKTLSIPFKDSTLTFVIRDGVSWGELDRDLIEGQSYTTRLLLASMVSWNLTEDDGVTICPITQENLARIPGKVLQKITAELFADADAKEEEKKSS